MNHKFEVLNCKFCEFCNLTFNKQYSKCILWYAVPTKLKVNHKFELELFLITNAHDSENILKVTDWH